MSTDSSYQLAIMQNEETGTVYTNNDMWNKNFVYHQLQVGKINQWEREIGQTDSGGAIRLASLTSPAGSASDMLKALGVSLVLSEATGRVVMSGTIYESFQGFLSDDKKTIVGTFTDNITDPAAVDIGQNDYHLIIFQMNDQTYPAGALPAGTSVAHLLGIGTATSSVSIGWSYFISSVTSGNMTFSDFHTSNSSYFTVPATTTGTISSSGVVAIAGTEMFYSKAPETTPCVSLLMTISRYGCFLLSPYIRQWQKACISVWIISAESFPVRSPDGINSLNCKPA
jgi:hypothetical protein